MALTKNSQIDLNGNEMILDADGDTTITADTDDQIDFKTAGSDRVTINSSGNVGIGTSSPASNLHISTTGEARLIVEGDSNNDSGEESALIEFKTDGGAVRHRVEALGSGGNDLKLIAGSADTSSSVNSNIIFETKAASASVTESMRIDSSGNVGISTTDPKSTLEVKGTFGAPATSGFASGFITRFSQSSGVGSLDVGFGDPYSWLQSRASNNYATNYALALNPNGGNVGIGYSSPTEKLFVKQGSVNQTIARFTGANNDRGLVIGTAISGSTNDSVITYDAVSTSSAGQHVFKTDGSERMRIDSSGNVVIGGTTAGRKFHVNGITRLEVSTAVNYPILEFYNTNGEVGRVRTSGIATAYDTSSDYRLKENVRPMENGLDRLNNLKPVKFDWKVDGTTSEGFIAHEAQEVFPDAVGGQKDGEDMQGMDYGRITPLLVKAIQEQQEQIEALQSEINILKGG